jgi:hypothetical protein
MTPVSEAVERVRAIDFRQNGWGHAMHGATWRDQPRQREQIWSWFPFITRPEPDCVRRFSVMVHTSEAPIIGREVIWNALGGVRRGRIYGVRHCGNPPDMMTLSIVIDDRETITRMEKNDE